MPHPGDSANRRIASLDGLRGVAALVVLVHHGFLLFPAFARLEYRDPAVTPTPLESALTFTPLHVVWAGDEAVLVFFVLSGFVLALPVFRPSRFAWPAYYPSRLVRLYLPVVGALVGAALLFVLAPWGPGPAGRGAPGSLTLQQVVLDASLLRGSASSLDNVLWSLHYELLFSLLLPLYVLVARLRTRRWPLLVTAVIALSSIARALDVETVAFLAVFAIGVVLARHVDAVTGLRDRIEALPRPAIAWWTLAAAAVVALLASWYPMPSAISAAVGWPALLLGASTLVVLAATWPALRRVLESRVLRWAGAISFSLYLVHLPIVSAVGHALGAAGVWAAFAISLPLALLVAWLFLVAVERPGHRLARRLARAIERARWRRTRTRPDTRRSARVALDLARPVDPARRSQPAARSAWFPPSSPEPEG